MSDTAVVLTDDAAGAPEPPVQKSVVPLSRVQLAATGVYTFFGVLPLLSQVFLFPINTRYLTPSDFGVTTLATVVRGYLILVMLFGVDAALGRLYFDCYRDAAALRRLLGTVFAALLGTTIVCVMVCAVAGDRLTTLFFGQTLSFSRYGWWTVSTAIFQMFGMVLLLFYRMSEHVKRYAVLALLMFALPTGGAFAGIAIVKLGALGSIAGRSLGQIVVAVPVGWFIVRHAGLSWDRERAMELLRFGLPVTFCALLAQSNMVLDKIMTAATFGLAGLGVYVAANTTAYALVYAVDGLWSAVLPDVFRLLVDRPEHMDGRLDRYVETVMLVGAACFVGLIATVEPVLHLLVSPAYQPAAYFVPLLAFGYLWRPIYLMALSDIYFQKRTAVLPLVYGGSLASMGLFFFLVGRHLGVTGICLAVVVAEFSQFAIAHLCSGRARERYFSDASRTRAAALFAVIGGVEAANYLALYPALADRTALNAFEAVVLTVVVSVLYRRQLVRLWQSRTWQVAAA